MLQPVPVASLHHLTIVRCAAPRGFRRAELCLDCVRSTGPCLANLSASFGVDTRRESRESATDLPCAIARRKLVVLPQREFCFGHPRPWGTCCYKTRADPLGGTGKAHQNSEHLQSCRPISRAGAPRGFLARQNQAFFITYYDG